MKTYLNYEAIPKNAAYLGSQLGDGSILEELADSIENALNPVCFCDEDSIKHYFDLIN